MYLSICNKTIISLALGLSLGLTSCSDDDSNTAITKTDSELQAILTQYVTHTVIATYNALADASLSLDSTCTSLYTKRVTGTATQADVNATCAAWLKARKQWEQSEAFLLGPATIKGIDPHIDTWPLDKTTLDKLLADQAVMADLDANYITTNYGSGGMCGFHALEYVIFAAGKAKDIADISTDETKYASAVAGDLKLQCVYLEAAWAGYDNVTAVKRQILSDADDIPDADTNNWGANFINAGQAGSRYKTQREALVDLLKADKGCYGIANEVGDTKITDPVHSGNVLDVESWYSYNSKEDFQDNIRGIQNVVMGGIVGQRNESLSIITYLKKKNASLAAALKSSIKSCIGEDGTTGLGTIIYPFRNHLTPTENQKAITACEALRDKLAEVATYLQENNQ